MPAVARNGDSTTTGHDCDASTTVVKPSTNVYANGLGVERKGDPTADHNIGAACDPHSAVINAGSGSVFVNIRPIARIGDSTDSGAIDSGSPNVFAGG